MRVSLDMPILYGFIENRSINDIAYVCVLRISIHHRHYHILNIVMVIYKLIVN